MIQKEFYFNDVCKQKLKQESVPKIGVELIKGNGKFYPYLYPFGDLAQRNFHKIFHVCTNQGGFS